MTRILWSIIEVHMAYSYTHTPVLKSRDRLISLDQPLVMGIINLTDDSFYNQSRAMDKDSILIQAHQMITDGADIIDLGAMSSRPGALLIAESEESDRLCRGIDLVHTEFPNILLSADASRKSVIQAAIDSGADIINDISGGVNDISVYGLCAQEMIPYICMHMRGTSATMHSMVDYEDILVDILDFFAERSRIMESKGLYDYILDPGFGFAKTLEQNYTLLKRLSSLQLLQSPILVGISRKSMIYKHLGTDPDRALNGTTALHMFALQQGARVLRVHDVREARETIALYLKLENS